MGLMWVECPCKVDHQRLGQMQSEVYHEFKQSMELLGWAWHNPLEADLSVHRNLDDKDIEGDDAELDDG